MPQRSLDQRIADAMPVIEMVVRPERAEGVPHVVPLPRLARELIAGIRRIEGFRTTGRSPVSGWTKVKNRLEEAMGNPMHWILHDLRPTAATGMSELGVALHVVKAVLNHISGAKAGVPDTDNRAAYAPEKMAALERWAAHIVALTQGKAADNLVPLRSMS